MRKLILLLMMGFSLVSCEPECLPDPTMLCLDYVDPVVCNDGVTYPNDCAAKREGQCDCKALNKGHDTITVIKE